MSGKTPPYITLEALAYALAGHPTTSTKSLQSVAGRFFVQGSAVTVRLPSGDALVGGRMHPYKKPHFVNGKEPHISFRAWHPAEQRLKRVRIYVPKALKCHEAIQWRKRMMYAIDAVLSGGAAFINPETPNWPEWIAWRKIGTSGHAPAQPKPPPRPTLLEALTQAITIKSREVRPRTGETYRNTVRRLTEWINVEGDPRMMPEDFKDPQILALSDWMLRERGINAVTRNNYFQTLRSVFSHVVLAGHLAKNPLSNFRQIPQDRTSRNTVIEPARMDMLLEWMRVNDPMLMLMVRMIYWTFARPVELARLKVRDVDPVSGVVLFAASITKTRVAGSVRIPADGRQMLARYLDGGAWDPELHLFTAGGKPGKKMVGENTFSQRHRVAVQACGLTETGITLYSWKHTGVCAAYDAGMDLFEIRDRCRHSTVSMTEVYLRDLGKWRPRGEIAW